jgi:hypothetical protein
MGEFWQPRPDPAIHDPQRPGMRPHVHEQNRLHPWVFLQGEVWVDYWGNEHAIALMPTDYVANVIEFCLRQAQRIRSLIALEALGDAVGLGLSGDLEEAKQRLGIGFGPESDATRWLEQTPLLRALRERLRAAPGSEPNRGGESS